MCLAIFKPADVVIPLESLRNGWLANPDGAGYAFAHKGKIIQRKGFTKLTEFLEDYQKAAARYKKCPGVVHFRIRSMGDKSESNTHPFEIADGVMIHNGTIDGTGASSGTGASDTSKFADKFGKDLTYEFCYKYKDQLDKEMGWNKLVMLYKDGSHVIINEKVGHWKEGVWYSNHTCNARPHSVPHYAEYRYND